MPGKRLLAQKIVTGTILDAESGETLPSVTLFNYATAEGTISNAAGQFELRLLQLPAQIDVRHIGYESQRIEITADSPSKLEIELVPVTYTLEEVFVSDEDPAYNIMRKVIEKKKEWQTHLATYTAESYSRYMLYSDFDLAQVQESISMHHWKRDVGTRSFVRARRMRPPGQQPMRFASTQNIPNFYDDTVEVLGFKLIGPTHPDATEVYTFTLGGYHEQDGQKVYDIYFSPRSGLSTAFIGHVSVLDSSYVLLKAQMRPSPDNVLPAPIQDWDVFYEQQFAPVGDSLWLPIDLIAEGHVSFGRLGVAYPTARYRQVSRLTKHVLNLPVPDSLFQSDDTVVEAPNVDRQDYLFRWNPGLIPMTPKEIEEVIGLDPSMTIGRSFRPIGVLANYTAIDLREEQEEQDVETRENLLEGVFSSARIYYDRVDGFYLGLARDVPIAQPLKLSFDVGYGLSSELPAYDVSLRYDIGLNTNPGWFFHKAYVQGGLIDHRATQYHSGSYTRLVSSVTTYIGWEDYFDYYDRTSQYGEIGFRAEKLKTTLAFRYARESHNSIIAHRDRKGWFFGNTRRLNPEISNEGDLTLLSSRLEIGNSPSPSMKAYPSGARFEVTHQPHNDNSFSRFTRYSGEVALTIPTFFKRRTWPNELRIRAVGATYSGSLPSQFASILESSRRPIAPFGGFKTLQGLPVKGENSWAVYWEHDFSTSLFEMLGLWGVAQNSIGLTIHGAHGQAFASNSVRRADLFSIFDDGPLHEIGISLTHFFNLPIRVDFTKPLTGGPVFVGVGLVKRL